MRNLMVAVDFSENTARILEQAKAFGQRHQCPILLVHIVDDEVDLKPEAEGLDCKRGRELNGIAEDFASAGLKAEAVLGQGPVVETLLTEVRNRDVDHILMGTHGRSGILESIMGSVSKGVIQNSALPVTLMPRL